MVHGGRNILLRVFITEAFYYFRSLQNGKRIELQFHAALGNASLRENMTL